MTTLLTAIVDDDLPLVRKLLKTDRELAVERVQKAVLYQSGIFHWLYVGDTALHLAAAGYRETIVRALLAAGADPNAAANHRRSGPLHYAADGYIVGPAWDPKSQVKTLRTLLKGTPALTIWRATRMAPRHCTAPSARAAPPPSVACSTPALIRRRRTCRDRRRFIWPFKTLVAGATARKSPLPPSGRLLRSLLRGA